MENNSNLNEFNPTKAIDQVKKLVSMMFIGPILVHRGLNGEIHIDVPLMYNGFALDRVHYDIIHQCPAPKGHNPIVFNRKIDKDVSNIIKNQMEGALKDIKVLNAVEFRDPESAWAVPIAWKNFIIAHIKVNYETLEIIQDYPLTQEVRKSVF